MAASRFAGRLGGVLLGLVVSLPVAAQVNSEAYRDYFLVSQFGEVCTMCEVTVLCEEGDDRPDYTGVPAAADSDFTLYHLQTRTFWAQMSTIYEWFMSNIKTDALAARGHTRPVFKYVVEQGVWSPQQIIEGRLVLDPGVLEFGEHNIDRVSRAWLDAATGEQVGYCQRLPLWGTLDAISARAAGEGS